MGNYQRWVTLAYVGLAAIVWLLVQQVGDVIWDLARLPIPESLPLTPPEVLAFLAALLLLICFRRNTRINRFANEVAVELVKVTWAPRKETIASTGVISLMVGLCAFILFFIDTIWGTLVKLWYK